LDGTGGGEVEVAGDVVPELFATAVKFGHEEGMLVFPAGEGGTVDAEAGADVAFVVVIGAEEEVHGVVLFLGERAVGGGGDEGKEGVGGVKMGKRNLAFCVDVAFGRIWSHRLLSDRVGSGGRGAEGCGRRGGRTVEICGHRNLPF
jgi:hypothetical protein